MNPRTLTINVLYVSQNLIVFHPLFPKSLGSVTRIRISSLNSYNNGDSPYLDFLCVPILSIFSLTDSIYHRTYVPEDSLHYRLQTQRCYIYEGEGVRYITYQWYVRVVVSKAKKGRLVTNFKNTKLTPVLSSRPIT